MPSHQPVCVRGKVYPTQVAVARKFNVCEATVMRMLDRGEIDDLGVKPLRRGGHPGWPVTIRGHRRYPSITAASKALNVSISAIAEARRRGTLDNVGLRKAKRRAAA